MGCWYRWEHSSFASFNPRFDPGTVHHFIKGNCMKRKSIVRERNCFVRLALFRKAGAHRKTNKALRRAQKQEPLGGETLR